MYRIIMNNGNSYTINDKDAKKVINSFDYSSIIAVTIYSRFKCFKPDEIIIMKDKISEIKKLDNEDNNEYR